MKKIFLTLCLVLGTTLCAEAQLLKGLANVAKDVADEVTDGKASELLDKITGTATELLIVGTWDYTQPAMTFEGTYDRKTILKWLKVFFHRFFTQQFKRSAMPDGPKVGGVGLSPRGDLHMPSDAQERAWLHEIEEMERELE